MVKQATATETALSGVDPKYLTLKTGNWVKRDKDDGKFMDEKADRKPFKGVTKER